LQFLTIPDPLSKRNANFYPVSLVMSIIWIFLYSYVICWFTTDISRYVLYTCSKGTECPLSTTSTPAVVPPGTEAPPTRNVMYSLIPMFVYPIGISLRDR
jgi:hypothetical protein